MKTQKVRQFSSNIGGKMTDMWKTTRCIPSSDENVFKYVFEKDTAVAESVLYKYPTFEERTVVCCSTQSGCPIGCRFCGAGDSFVRSLNADEIVSQTQHLFADKGIDAEKVQRMQIMFMSMGEPLLNLKELVPAIRKLNALYPKAALLVSTSAPKVDYQPMIDISKEIDKVGLQFSVHESTDEARNALIPFKNKLTLQEIAIEGERWAMEVGRQPFFNYCAHEKNTSNDDVDRLVNLFEPGIWQATISVICEREETVAAANARQRDLAADFQQKLMLHGYSTRMFDPAGQDDVGGGCGQLWFVQSWMKNNPQLARPSIGRHLPVVHTPR
jgi:23S rRNA (adenine2503-C2)-methyltransferase